MKKNGPQLLRCPSISSKLRCLSISSKLRKHRIQPLGADVTTKQRYLIAVVRRRIKIQRPARYQREHASLQMSGSRVRQCPRARLPPSPFQQYAPITITKHRQHRQREQKNTFVSQEVAVVVVGTKTEFQGMRKTVSGTDSTWNTALNGTVTWQRVQQFR